MPLFRRRKRRTPPELFVGEDLLVVGGDLARGLHDPGPAPTQADLDAVIGPATAVAVRGLSTEARVLHTTDDPSDLASLREALRIEGVTGHCMCMGTVAFVFRSESGVELGTVTLHHGVSLRWEPFFLDATLVASGPILDWLSARGMPKARDEYDDAQRESVESANATERWHAAMPAALEPLLSTMSELSFEWPEIAEKMNHEYPDAVGRARALMEWYGQGEGPWSGYPMHETVPQWCLLQIPIDALIEAAQSEPRTEPLLEGAARLFAGHAFYTEREDDLERLPGELKRLLLEHSLASADEDKRARATDAFAA